MIGNSCVTIPKGAVAGKDSDIEKKVAANFRTLHTLNVRLYTKKQKNKH